MKAANVAETVKSEHAVALLKQMYGEKRAEENAARYQLVADGFAKEFGDKAFEFFSAPGRTEIGGNHTDHNHEKSWQEVYIWIVWQQLHPTEPTL